MALTEWMTTTEVKTMAVHKTSFDDSVIDDHIFLAQYRYLRPALGDDFYEEIEAQVAASSISADNTTLLNDYLKKALAHFVLYMCFYKHNFQESSKGTRRELSDYSEPVSGSDMENKRSNLLEIAQIWLNSAQQYIEKAQESDSSKFPNYSSNITDEAQEGFNQEYIPD